MAEEEKRRAAKVRLMSWIAAQAHDSCQCPAAEGVFLLPEIASDWRSGLLDKSR